MQQIALKLSKASENDTYLCHAATSILMSVQEVTFATQCLPNFVAFQNNTSDAVEENKKKLFLAEMLLKKRLSKASDESALSKVSLKDRFFNILFLA